MITKEHLSILACPVCKADIKMSDESSLVCPPCGLNYQIKDGIPILLADEATVVQRQG